MKYFLYFFSLLALAGLIAPDFTRAQTDQRCWLEKDCLEQRKFISLDTLSDKDLKAGFIINTETVKECGTDKNAAGQRIGFCLPAGQAETAISFGGKRRFGNMGEFIAEMYRYGTWAATIIAVFMILISGIQWMVSGGNSTMIDAAKHRIGGAIIGLVLLALSYTILGMLNPYLVNFRLPAVWLINEIEISPPSCNQLQAGQKVLQMSEAPNEKLTLDDKEEFYKKNRYSANFTPIGAMTITKCGFEYLVEDAGAQTCTGTMCVDATGNITKGVCAPYDIVGGSNLKLAGSNCMDNDIVVHLKLNAVDQQFFNGSWLIGFTGVQKLVGSKAVIEAPEWLDFDDKYIYYSCDGGGTFTEIKATKDNHLDIDKAKPQKATKTTLEVPGMFNEYELHYYSLDKIKCASGSQLGYVILGLEIEIAGATGEPSLYVGRNGNTGQAVLGTAADVAQFAIPLGDIHKGGIYLEGQLDRSVLISVGEKPDSKFTPAKLTPEKAAEIEAEESYKCLLAGTQIATVAGNKPIEKIRPGEFVWSYDPASKRKTIAQVTKTITQTNKSFYNINNGLLEFTEAHPIYIRKANGFTGWGSMNPDATKRQIPSIEGELMEIGDEILMQNGKWTTVSSIKRIEARMPTYNIQVTAPHTFYANGVLTHNKEW